MKRATAIERKTNEVDIVGMIDLDGSGRARVDTGLGFLDHMLITLSKHAGFDLELSASGDIEVDDHHVVEDCGVVIGRAIDTVLADRIGIARFGYAYAPLDESLCRAVVDLSGRGWSEISIPFARESIGAVATENLIHFFRSLAVEGRMALHIDLLRGENDHHKAEAAFKALAVALRSAVRIVDDQMPSTKGTLT